MLMIRAKHHKKKSDILPGSYKFLDLPYPLQKLVATPNYSISFWQLDQELYFVELQYIVALLKLLTKENETHEPQGVFTQAEFTQLLSTFFSGDVSETDMEALLAAAQVELDDSETTDIEFTRLFFEVLQ